MGYKIRLHYLQTKDPVYKDWGLYIWGSGYGNYRMKWGNPLSIAGVDEYGAYWDVPCEGEGKVNFLIHNDKCRVSDIGGQLRVTGNKEVWVVANDNKIYDSLEDALRAASFKRIPPIPDNFVRLHYYRGDNDYSGWKLCYWRENEATGEVIEEGKLAVKKSNVGGYWDIPCLSRKERLKFLIQNGDNIEFGGEQEYPLEKANKELWIVSEEQTKYFNSFPILDKQKNSIKEAMIINSTQIKVIFEKPVTEPIKIKLGSRSVPLAHLEEHHAPTYYLTTQQELDFNQNYTVKSGELEVSPILSPEIIENNFIYQGELGAFYTSEKTTFKLWAPSASSVYLKLYKDDFSTEAYQIIPMKRRENGVWQVKVEEDLSGEFYRYEVLNNQAKEVLDPYAKSMASFNIDKDNLGKGSIVDLERTNPEGWEKDNYIELESQEDVIIYEMSVRDFTIDENSGVEKEKRGTYLGFIEKIPYLQELGITHVQLMPILNFYYGDESYKEFEDVGDDVDGNYNYNWGYDPHNYFTPEGWYSQDSFDPHLRIKEVKQLVKALHDAGIGVILDVVYNHTAIAEILEDIVPYYYYRRHEGGTLTNGSGCGNDTASEREMMRKLIIDSVTYWTSEYHVDGFRFDLMGLHDEKTMKRVKEEVRNINPDAVIHGEGWNLGTLPQEQKYVKADGEKRSLLRVENGPAVFNDGIRDAIKQGHFGASLEEGGFVQQHDNDKPLIRAGIIAGIVDYHDDIAITLDPYHRFTDEPKEVINYVSCHDGYTLWDKIVKSTPHATEEQRKRMDKLATAIVLTAQGKPFIHGGEEMLRTKPNPERPEGVDPNSYNSSDFTNQIDWSRKEKYIDVFEYYQGLIKLRKEHKAFKMETMEEIKAGLKFLIPEIDYVVGFSLTHPEEIWDKIVVIYNSNREAKTVKVEEVNSNWKVVVDGEKAGVKELAETEVKVSSGEVIVPPIATVVMHK